MITLVLLLALVQAPPAVPVATVFNRQLTSADVFREAAPNPLDRGYEAVREAACRQIFRAVRLTAEEAILLREKVWASEQDLKAEIRNALPTKAELEAKLVEQNRTSRNLERALVESEGDPTRDHEIWKALVAPVMDYQSWVEFRLKMHGQPRKLSSVPETLSDQSAAAIEGGIRNAFIEGRFQTWLLSISKAADTGPWTNSIQDSFWEKELQSGGVSVSDSWKCGSLGAREFRAPRISTPNIRANVK